MSARPTLIVALLLTLAILALSALPTEAKHALHLQGAFHPWLHLIAFTLLAFLLLSTTRSTFLRILFFAALLAFGYATEAYESHKDGWPIEQKDVRTDAAGVLFGSLLSLVPIRRPTP